MRSALSPTFAAPIVVLLGGALAGCMQSARGGLRACAAQAPLADGLTMSAEVPGFGAAAKRSALGTALADGLGPILGVGVKSQLAITEATRAKDGVSQSVTDAREDLVVSFGAATVKDYSVSYCEAPNGGTHADVRVAGSEVERLKRLARDATLVVVGCSSAAPGACTDDLRDRAKAIAEEAGLSVGDAVLVNGEPAADDLRTRALRAGAAKTLVLRLDAPTVFAESPYRVCRAQGAATLTDVDDLKVLHTAKPQGFGVDGGFKGVVYADKATDRDACSKAFREALDALKPITASWASNSSMR